MAREIERVPEEVENTMPEQKKILHILKTEPDELQMTLMKNLSKNSAGRQFPLYVENVDYDELIDLIFEHDQVITWW